MPGVTIDPRVGGISAALATQQGARELAATSAWNLQVEAETITSGDATLLPAISDGARLHEITALIEDSGKWLTTATLPYDFQRSDS